MLRPLLIGTAIALMTLVSQAAACSEQEQLTLLTGALYKEANPTDHGQAAVAAVIFNRTKMPEWRATSICAVITAPSQFQYRVPGKPDRAKLALAKENAAIFLQGFTTGHYEVAEEIFDVFQRKRCFGFVTGHGGYSVDGNSFRCKR